MIAKRLLVVEDEPMISMMLEDWLIEMGFHVVGPASTVAAALDLLGSDGVDGAILDVTLAHGTSYALADELVRRSVPIVFATGHSGATLEARFAGVPMLAKPYDFDAVQKCVTSLLD